MLSETVAGDLLIGRKAIAAHLGATSRRTDRLIYDNVIPTFKLGGSVAARRSAIDAKIAEIEAATARS